MYKIFYKPECQLFNISGQSYEGCICENQWLSGVMLLGTTIGNYVCVCMCMNVCVCECVYTCMWANSLLWFKVKPDHYFPVTRSLPHPVLVIPICLNAQNGDGGSCGFSEARSPSPLHIFPLLEMCMTLPKWIWIHAIREMSTRAPPPNFR